jgi:hypothetical protein
VFLNRLLLFITKLLTSARVSDFAVLTALCSIAYYVALAKIALHYETKRGHFAWKYDIFIRFPVWHRHRASYHIKVVVFATLRLLLLFCWLLSLLFWRFQSSQCTLFFASRILMLAHCFLRFAISVRQGHPQELLKPC